LKGRRRLTLEPRLAVEPIDERLELCDLLLGERTGSAERVVFVGARAVVESRGGACCAPEVQGFGRRRPPRTAA